MGVTMSFVQEIFPHNTTSWDKLVLPIAGFWNSASKEGRYKSARGTVLYMDGRSHSHEDFNSNLQSRTLANMGDLTDFTGDANIKAVARALLVAGLAIECFEHTKRALFDQQSDTSADDVPRSLKLDYQWLNICFTPTTIRALDGWANWVRTCLNTVKDIRPFCEKYHLGTRYYMLWRALYAFGEDEQREANDYAFFYAKLVTRNGYGILKQVLTENKGIGVTAGDARSAIDWLLTKEKS